MPDVSVSLVNTNSRELLLACLESLRETDVEIVVLDNASEDGSAAAVRERFPEVRWRDGMVTAELNTGQLAMLIRARFLIDAKTYSKVQGQPIFADELERAILELV